MNYDFVLPVFETGTLGPINFRHWCNKQVYSFIINPRKSSKGTNYVHVLVVIASLIFVLELRSLCLLVSSYALSVIIRNRIDRPKMRYKTYKRNTLHNFTIKRMGAGLRC